MEPLEGGHYNSDSRRVLTTKLPLRILFSRHFALHSFYFTLLCLNLGILMSCLLNGKKKGANALYLINKSIRKAFV